MTGNTNRLKGCEQVGLGASILICSIAANYTRAVFKINDSYKLSAL